MSLEAGALHCCSAPQHPHQPPSRAALSLAPHRAVLAFGFAFQPLGRREGEIGSFLFPLRHRRVNWPLCPPSPVCPARSPHVPLHSPPSSPPFFPSKWTVSVCLPPPSPAQTSLTNDEHFLGSALDSGMSVFTPASIMVFGASQAWGLSGGKRTGPDLS